MRWGGSGGIQFSISARERAAPGPCSNDDVNSGLEGELRVRFSDLYPSQTALLRDEEDLPWVDFERHSVSASDVPEQLAGFRTLFSAFHHFEADAARAIPAEAVARGLGIGVFEPFECRWSALIGILFSPIFTWLLAPFIQPSRWSRLLFYLPDSHRPADRGLRRDRLGIARLLARRVARVGGRNGCTSLRVGYRHCAHSRPARERDLADRHAIRGRCCELRIAAGAAGAPSLKSGIGMHCWHSILPRTSDPAGSDWLTRGHQPRPAPSTWTQAPFQEPAPADKRSAFRNSRSASRSSGKFRGRGKAVRSPGRDRVLLRRLRLPPSGREIGGCICTSCRR